LVRFVPFRGYSEFRLSFASLREILLIREAL
jgi:hypothetical protein